MTGHFELANCTEHLLREISDKKMTRDDVALSYALAFRSSEKTDWKRVNEAILGRWSLRSLEYIKQRAWDRMKPGRQVTQY